MRRFYYEDAEKPWRPDGSLRQFLRRKKKRVPRLRPSGSARNDKPTYALRALDLGMGYGRNAIWLAERGYRVEGWERDGRYVREARSEWQRRRKEAGAEHLFRTGKLVVRRGDFTKAKLRAQYDVIVISQALHQVKRSAALKVLRKAATRLRAPLRLRFPRPAMRDSGQAGQARYGGQAGGRLFLLVKLTSDRHFQRVRRDPSSRSAGLRPSPAWKAVRGERNTFLRPSARKRGSYHAGRPRTPQMVLSALEPGEIRRALKGLRVVHWRRVVLRSDWEEEVPVTHTVAEVVAERV